jgi:cell division protein FtsB
MTDTLERNHTDPPRAPRRRSRLRSMVFVALLVSVGLMAAGVLPVQQYLERENQVDAARAQLAELEERNAELADDAAALASDQEIERIAREQYGFVKPGEVGYVVITPDPVVVDRTAPEPAPAVEEPRSLLQRIWDFITGGDADSDG